MISAQNHLLQLNGNRSWLLIILLLVSCSPKVVPVKDNKPVVSEKPAEPVPAPPKKRAALNLALLLPFEIKKDAFTKADVERAELAIDFYQGFKLGVDSAAAEGQDFNISVVDSKGSNQQIGSALRQDGVRSADIVIGPVFPESLKQLGKTGDQYFVSPLAAAMPAEFNNPKIISLVPNISLHAAKIAGHIKKRYKAEGTIVVLINPKNEDSEVFGAQIRKQFAGSKMIFQEYTAFSGLETRFQKNKQYAVIISSADKNFVSPTIDKLAKIKKRLNYPIDLYGHPNWPKQNYNTEQLQALNTAVTSSYRVNYKRNAVTSFIKKYRAAYAYEPNEYAFKGFDAGLYFAKLTAKYGAEFAGALIKEDYTGLQNNYSFYKDDQLGYINTGLWLLRYKNFLWGVVE